MSNTLTYACINAIPKTMTVQEVARRWKSEKSAMEGWQPWQKQKKQAMGKPLKFKKFTKIKHELEEQDIRGGYRKKKEKDVVS